MRILLVDGDAGARAALERTLRVLGDDVVAVASAPEARDAVMRHFFELVVTEAELPGASGIALLQRLRIVAPALDVIVMAGRASIVGAVEAMQGGALSYLEKPVDAASLRALRARAPSERKSAIGAGTSTSGSGCDAILGASPGIRVLLDLVRMVAETDTTVLITGETGTGKELVGKAIHQASLRRDRPFCALSATAFPERLLESELFGHRRGAFTGAAQHERGLLEAADQGTLFLDEVAEMPLSMQAKLLRFLQTGEIRPVGGETTRFVDVRLVTATHKDLEAEVRAGRFREDLFYRLAVIPIHVPPLRERVEDVPQLALHFVERFSARLGKPVLGIDDDVLERLARHPWPGNVRELENTIERGVALCRGPRLTLAELPDRLRRAAARSEAIETASSLELLERRHILATLERVAWNRKQAARILQISTTTLWRRLKVFGVDPPSMRSAAPNAAIASRPL